MPARKIFKSSGRAARVPHRNRTKYTFDDPQKAAIASSLMMMRLDGALLAIEERHDQLYMMHGPQYHWAIPYDDVMKDLYSEADMVMRLMIRSGYLHYRPTP